MGYINELRALIGTRPIIMAGVSVIVLNEFNHILLQKRSDTLDWGLIGGALELGESIEEAAHRELYEEAGLESLDLTFKCMVTGRDMYYRYPHGDEIYNHVAVFETKNVIGEPKIMDDEGLELKYFDLDSYIENLNIMAIKILSKSGYISPDLYRRELESQ